MNHSIPEMQEKESPYMQAAGKLPYTLINDYMFKALLQKNENVLKHLVCSLLHLRLEEIQSVEVKPTIHIGFLDFILFPEQPEFYATYKMMNVINHHIFTDKIALSVVNLKHIELATLEDREWEIDYWASLFKATTWEELKMLAERNQVMGDAVNTIYGLTADESIREQCKAREKHIKEMNTILKEREIAVRERDEAFRQLEQAKQERDAAFQQLEQERDAVFQQLEQERDAAFQQLEQRDLQIAKLMQEIRQLKGAQD